MEFLLFAFTCVFVQNVVLVQFLGICPFLGVSKKVETAFGMGLAVIFVITLSSLLTWVVHNFILVPLGLEYMQTVIFILVIAALVQLVEMFLQKSLPALYSSLGIYLPLITTNCAVLGVSLLNIQNGYNLLYTFLFGFFSALGFLVSILLLAGVQERLALADVPKIMRGIPITLISAGLIAITFMAF